MLQDIFQNFFKGGCQGNWILIILVVFLLFGGNCGFLGDLFKGGGIFGGDNFIFILLLLLLLFAF